MWYPQIQFTFRFFDPATKKSEWRSTNVTNFSAPPPSSVHSTSGQAYDKRSCKSDQFSILVDPAAPDTYHIQGNYDANTQISITYKRVDGVPGWKLGAGPKGGMTYFGAEKGANSTKDSEGPAYSNASDGYVVHRFWPKCSVTGIVRMGNDVVSLEKGTNGIFIHAIQGMRPNLIAQKWNFGYFSSSSSSEGGEGAEAKEDTSTSVVMMEFTTPSNYGAKTVNVGSIVVDDQLVAVIADGIVTHLDTDPIDPDTGYPAPGKIQYSWKNGTSLLPSLSKQAGSGKVEAEIVLDVTADEASADGQRNFKGLIEKVDVLAQIPYLVKKVISYVAGTKPYIYTVSGWGFSGRHLSGDSVWQRTRSQAELRILTCSRVVSLRHGFPPTVLQGYDCHHHPSKRRGRRGPQAHRTRAHVQRGYFHQLELGADLRRRSTRVKSCWGSDSRCVRCGGRYSLRIPRVFEWIALAFSIDS